MSSLERRQAPWQREQRYYCAVCNAWMGSDRQSILLHENGKKHRENLERATQERRIKKQREEKAQKLLSDSLKQMEQAALAGTGGDTEIARTTKNYRSQSEILTRSTKNHSHYPHSLRSRAPLPSVTGPSHLKSKSQALNFQMLPSNHSVDSELQQEKIDWQTQKLKLEEVNSNKTRKRQRDDINTGKNSKAHIAEKGYYSYDNLVENDEDRETVFGRNNTDLNQGATIYLEADVFFGLLEKDMPIQLWIGPPCSRTEKRLSENARNWKHALVIQVVNHQPEKDESQRPRVHVSYLSSIDDTDEILEKDVSLDRIRILLGSDEKIPDSLEEARLLASGGQEIDFTDTATDSQKQQINEATGLSGWSTVSIKKTSHRQQHREERKRFEQSKLLAAKKRETEEKRIAERRLEESRVSNAEDSALGAYDVWGKMNYKGVDISKEANCSVEDASKKLSAATNHTPGAKVAFKKRAKKRGQKVARRRTSADDD